MVISTMWRRTLAAVACLVLLLAAAPARAEAPDAAQPQVVGSIRTVTGEAHIERNGTVLTAHLGDHLYQNDVLSTGAAASLGVIFRDDTMLSMGSGSRVVIDAFVFDPANSAMQFLVKVGKGTAQFITGQMAKIAPERMQVETPLATIGIRGTRFLVKVD